VYICVRYFVKCVNAVKRFVCLKTTIDDVKTNAVILIVSSERHMTTDAMMTRSYIFKKYGHVFHKGLDAVTDGRTD